jgi:hypothetical protein
MLKADHSSLAPALLFGVGMGTLWAGKADIWLSRDPLAHSGTRPELAPLGLDSGTRGYNPRCRDTPALPLPSSLEWAKARFGREKPIHGEARDPQAYSGSRPELAPLDSTRERGVITRAVGTR